MADDTVTETTISLLQDVIRTGHEALGARLGAQDRMLDRILMEQKRTNGRVTALETREAAGAGEREAHRAVKQHRLARTGLMVSTLAVLASGALGAVLTLVIR